MAESPSFDRDFKLWVLLHQTRDAIQKTADKELRRFGLSPMEAALIFAVHSIGERATPAEISRWLFRESHSVSGLLDRMQKKGLVRRSKDLDKKNLVRVSLTDKARQFYNAYAEMKAIDTVLSCLSEEERDCLGASLEKLRDKALDVLGVERAIPFPGPFESTSS